MKTFLNLRLAVRLGIAFGSLVIALVIIAAVGINGVGAVDEDADRLSTRDIAALEGLVTISEDFSSSAYNVVKHLYVEDGDLAAQDKTAKEIAAARSEADETLAEIEPMLDTAAAQATFADFSAAMTRFDAETAKAIKLSRQETVDGVEERDASRDQYAQTLMPVIEQLDKIHDELEGDVTAQGDKSAEEANASAASVRRTVLDRRRAWPSWPRSAWRSSPSARSCAPWPRSATACAACTTTASPSSAAPSAPSPQGDLTVEVVPVTEPVTVNSRDEIGQLSATFNQMLEKMKGSIESYSTMRQQLGALILDVSTNAGTVSAASQQMASTSDEAGRAVGEIASAVTDVAQGAERQVRMVETTREAVQEAARAAAVELGHRRVDGRGRRAGPRRRPRRRLRRRPGDRGDPAGGGQLRRGRPGDRGPLREVRAHRRHRRHHHRHRRADEPPGAQRRHRGRPRRRAGPRLRRGRRGGPQAGRGVPGGRRADLRADRRDPDRDRPRGRGGRRGRQAHRRRRRDGRADPRGVRGHRHAPSSR